MFYPESFANKVKATFSNDEEICKALEEGDLNLGLLLSSKCQKAPSIDTILAATSLEELKKDAETAKKTIDLFNEWRELCQNYKIYNG